MICPIVYQITCFTLFIQDSGGHGPNDLDASHELHACACPECLGVFVEGGHWGDEHGVLHEGMIRIDNFNLL